MAQKPDLKKQLEKLLGHELDADAVQRLNFWSPVALYSFVDEGHTTWSNIIGLLPKHCDPSPFLDASGVAATGNDGKAVFKLSDFVCLAAGQYTFAAPVNVVATPQSVDPVFLTVQHTLINAATDVEIRAATWDTAGGAAPNVVFDWRCRVVYWTILLRSMGLVE
jgi:hypothetical protein